MDTVSKTYGKIIFIFYLSLNYEWVGSYKSRRTLLQRINNDFFNHKLPEYLGLSMLAKIPITNEKLKHAILAALADQEMVNIMNSAIIWPKSINDIIRETVIPHTTAYRKIKWMLEYGLLTVDKIVVSKDGKKFSLIKSVFKSIDTSYEYDKVSIVVEHNMNIIQKTAQRIFSLDS
jgi:hypothetical protein